MAKRDIDFIPGMGISETERDRLSKKDWTKPADHSDHPDSWTTEECRQKRYSGWRINAFVRRVELWMVGRIVADRAHQDVINNPGILGDMLEEGCGTNGSFIEVDVPTKRIQMKGGEAKKHGK